MRIVSKSNMSSSDKLPSEHCSALWCTDRALVRAITCVFMLWVHGAGTAIAYIAPLGQNRVPPNHVVIAVRRRKILRIIHSVEWIFGACTELDINNHHYCPGRGIHVTLVTRPKAHRASAFRGVCAVYPPRLCPFDQ